MTELEKMQKQYQSLGKKIIDLREKERREKEVPQLRRKYKDTYWKFRNSYGSDDPDKKWWSYRYIADVTKDGAFVMLEVQIDCDKNLTVSARTWPFPSSTGWIKSNIKEWREVTFQADEITDGLFRPWEINK